MKKILLIEELPYTGKTIKSYLANFDATCSSFSSVEYAIRSDEVPHLVVLIADKNAEKFKKNITLLESTSSFSGIPRIFVLPLEMDRTGINLEIIESPSCFHVPVDKSTFLSTVTTFLKRAPRRVCQILVTIRTEKSNLKYSGVSLDISESGMAFQSIPDFPVGQKVTLTFVNPGIRQRVLLNAEVVRKKSNLLRTQTFYGVHFLEMAEESRKVLTNFILGRS
jgi:hypothetical protein